MRSSRLPARTVAVSMPIPIAISVRSLSIRSDSVVMSIAVVTLVMPVAIRSIRTLHRAVPIAHRSFVNDHDRTHHPRQNFRLSIFHRRMVRKRQPQRGPLRVLLTTRNERTTTRNVDGGAHFGFLAEWGRPAESCR